MTLARKLSYGLILAGGATVVWLDLGPVLLTGLFSYMILSLTYRAFFSWHLLRTLRADAVDREAGRIVPFQQRLAETGMRLTAVGVFVLVAALLTAAFGVFVRLAVMRTPVILSTLLPRLDALGDAYGIDLPLENLERFRHVVMAQLRENATSVTVLSGFLTRRLFQLAIVVFAAVSAFWNLKPSRPEPNLFYAVKEELGARLAMFMSGFEKILGAQIVISFINMWITVVFLSAMEIPYIPFLSLTTFICGIVPVIGNLVSNSIIVATALTVSPRAAGISLIFLVVIHKLQYFMSSRIIGSRIDTPMWQILLGMLVGEAVLGVPGVVLAPAVIHYAREELKSIPYRD